MKNKKNIIIIASILIAGVVGGFYFFVLPEKTTSSQLSDRAQEFMATQKRSDNQVWRNVVTNEKISSLNQEIKIEDCFTVKIPFVIKHATTGKECVATVTVENGGTITISLRIVAFESLDESPDVIFRRTKSEEYKESKILLSNRQFVTFQRTLEGYEKTAFIISNAKYMTISLVKPTNELYEKEFSALLASIELL